MKVEDDDLVKLPITVKAADALDDLGWIPRQVVIDHYMAIAVKIEPFTTSLGGDQD